uniref:G-protein coupled receptors family 1 profile domain-containing protein n=1 Tax=Monopterus albus TaxID=43700 RepID=A0A3Q3QW90_MONAL
PEPVGSQAALRRMGGWQETWARWERLLVLLFHPVGITHHSREQGRERNALVVCRPGQRLMSLLFEPCWFLGDLICVLLSLISCIILLASILNMILISVDRYVAICNPLRYPTKITQKRVQVFILLFWIYAVFYSFLLLYDNLKQPSRYNSCYGECVINYNRAVDIVLFFILPITAIIILYMRVFVVAVSQAQMKAARTLGVLVAVFLMCYCPYYCVILYGYDIMMGSSSMAFVFLLVYFNSCLNPVIYPFFYPWFRKSVKLIVTLEILQPNSCEANVL